MRLKELRKAHKLKQTDIAEVLSCSQGVYSRYESEEREPPFDIIKKLAEYYGVTIDYLMGVEATNDQPAPVPEQEKAPADMRAEAKMLLERMSDDEYQQALEILRVLHNSSRGTK